MNLTRSTLTAIALCAITVGCAPHTRPPSESPLPNSPPEVPAPPSSNPMPPNTPKTDPSVPPASPTQPNQGAEPKN
jgi:hypothetical protein